MDLVQYPGFVAPKEPTLHVEPPPLSWYQPASEPVYPLPMPDPGWQVAITEPTLYVQPPELSWYRPASEPVRTIPPTPEAGGVYICDPSDWPVEPLHWDWFQPISQPVAPLPPAPEAGAVYVAEPSLLSDPIAVLMDGWYRPISEPVREQPPWPPGGESLVLETAFVAPWPWDWMSPTAQPVAEEPPAGALSALVEPPRVIGLARWYADARGRYRVFNAAEYRFYWSHVRPPEEGWWWNATNSTLPYTPANVFSEPPSPYWFSVSYFNGVIDSGLLPVGPNGETYLRLDLSGGSEIGSPPPGPMDWRLESQGAGVVRVLGFVYQLGTDQADEWAIAYTIDGSTPPADTPDLTVSMTVGGLQVLEYDLPAQADGVTLKVRLQTRRDDGTAESPDWVYSEGSTIRSILIDATGPTAPLDTERWAGPLPEDF